MIWRLLRLGLYVVVLPLVIFNAYEFFGTIPYLTENIGFKVLIYLCSALALVGICALPIVFEFQPVEPVEPRRRLRALLIAEFIFLVFIFALTPHSIRHFFREAKYCRSCDFELGGINLSEKPFDDDALVARFGVGCSTPTRHGDTLERTYYFSKQDVVAHFGKTIYYDSMSLARPSGEEKGCSARIQLGSSSTSKGISLGDSESRIVSVYGRPSEKSRNQDEVRLLYNGPGKFSSFIFVADKLVRIHVGADNSRYPLSSANNQ